MIDDPAGLLPHIQNISDKHKSAPARLSTSPVPTTSQYRVRPPRSARDNRDLDMGYSQSPSMAPVAAGTLLRRKL